MDNKRLSLNAIGLNFKTDKASDGHNYLHFYERYLQHLREESIILVEAGIGGYEFRDQGGQSLRMWSKYFQHPDTKIYGFDKFDKGGIISTGATILQIDQTDEAALLNAFGNMAIDVFIDDASHINPLSIRTFEIMFPLVKPGGVYIWEDIHTSYWTENYNGYPDPDLGNYLLQKPIEKATAAAFLHRLQDGLQVDTLEEQYRGPWDGHVEEIHFMRNTCVIIKRK
jgi:hypothetical protein